MEGKIYPRIYAENLKETNDDFHKCRCEFEDVPNNLVIMDNKNNIISLNAWIRYGGSREFIC